jgi:hypothetical protein
MFVSMLKARYSSELRSVSSWEVLLVRSCWCVEEWVYGNHIPRLPLFLFRGDDCYCSFGKNWLHTIRCLKSSANCVRVLLSLLFIQLNAPLD